MGIEVGGRAGGQMEIGLGGRESEVGSRDGGGVGWEVGWGRDGGGADPTYLQSNNKHTRNNQCKMIMGNIIVCPAGPKKFKY